MPTAYLVYNPAAGRFPSQYLTERAADVLRIKGWQIQILKTHGGDEITKFARQAVTQKMDAFFVAGGDGSINYAIRGLIDSDTALGVLPAGTANVWAKEIGLPDLTLTRLTALEESAEIMATSVARRIDIGFCDHRPFLLWGGVGLDAFVIHSIEPRTRLEKNFATAQYAASALQQASVYGGFDLHIHVDDEVVSGHYLLAVATNIHLYAGGLAELSPSARIDDGIMDLWLFAGDTWVEAVTHAWDLWNGRHLHSEHTHCIPFRDIAISSDSQLYIQIDGEPIDANEQATISVKQKALKVLVPEVAPRLLFSDIAKEDDEHY